jgi:hypothetical protein
VYVGVGCGVLAILALVVVVALVVFVGRTVREVSEQFTDPAARTERAAELLGAETLPEGYNAMMTFSIPWVVDLVMLSDARPDAEGKIESFDSSGFIYVKSIQKGADRQRMQDYFDGRIGFEELFRDSGMDMQMQGNFGFDRAEEIARGTVERDDVRIVHVSNSGRIRLDRGWSDGVGTFMLMECPGDEKMRLGIWFSSEAETGGDAAEAIAGTIADPQVIREFTGHFRPCD